jgi:hypothetical protein
MIIITENPQQAKKIKEKYNGRLVVLKNDNGVCWTESSYWENNKLVVVTFLKFYNHLFDKLFLFDVQDENEIDHICSISEFICYRLKYVKFIIPHWSTYGIKKGEDETR